MQGVSIPQGLPLYLRLRSCSLQQRRFACVQTYAVLSHGHYWWPQSRGYSAYGLQRNPLAPLYSHPSCSISREGFQKREQYRRHEPQVPQPQLVRSRRGASLARVGPVP